MEKEKMYTFRTVLQTLADEYDIRTSALRPLVELDEDSINRAMDEDTYYQILSSFEQAIEDKTGAYACIQAIARLARIKMPDEVANQHLTLQMSLDALPKA